jgi:hypothetical protein
VLRHGLRTGKVLEGFGAARGIDVADRHDRATRLIRERVAMRAALTSASDHRVAGAFIGRGMRALGKKEPTRGAAG